jgi:fucose permease
LTLTAALAVLGFAGGAMDVSMNAHAVAVERIAHRHLMSGFHALFSVGGMAGSALGGAIASAGIGPRLHFGMVAAASVALTCLAIPALLPGHVDAAAAEHGRLRFSRRLAGLSALAFCLFLAEGAVADWSALYLHGSAGLSAGRAAYGYALFSAAMAIGRFSGDALRHRFLPQVLVACSCATAAAGFAVALAFPAAALAGFAIVGAGCSIVVPIVFASAGNLNGVSPGPALAVMTTCGYAGLFAGPPVIGFAAEKVTLRIALLLVVFLAAIGIPLSSAVRRGTVAECDEQGMVAPQIP